MVHDIEKGDLSPIQHVPQDFGGPVEHPGAPTIKDDEDSKTERDQDSIHSQSSISVVEESPIEQQRSKSRGSSNRSRAISVIPRSKRRGLLSRFTLIAEVERPYEYKRSTKWFITFLVALAAAAAPIGSAIFLPALPQLSSDLHTTPTVTNLSVAMYMLSMSIFPLWWSSFSERLGRRTIYLVSFAFFTIWNIVAAVSTSIGMLIVMRILGGGAAASVQAVGAGTIADIWEVRERGRAMGMFYLGPLMGPLLAPFLEVLYLKHGGWRSTQWFQAIYGGVLFITLTLFLPETLAPKATPTPAPTLTNQGTDEKAPTTPPLTRSSTRQSVQQKTKKFVKIFKMCIVDPLSVLVYLRFPAVALSVYLASITFGSLYILNISIQQTFSEKPYHYSVMILGLLYIPNSLGYLLASLFGGRWTDKIMHREARAANRYDENGKLVFIPEDRLRENAYLAAIMFPGALIWYGWTADKGVFWLVPMIANFFFGVGSMIVFGTITTMLTELMPRRSSSGVAVNNFVRNIFSCVGGVVAQPIISAIGNGWLFTILGILCWISSFGVVWAMRYFGPRWRVSMEKKLNS